MHQRHNIRHNLHQTPLMRPPHIPSQINVSIPTHHPQPVNMQHAAPPQMPAAPQSSVSAQQAQQHTKIAMPSGPRLISPYIPPSHQRNDHNRLGHHLPPSSQQQQPQQSQQQQPPPQQVSLQQIPQPQQRISPQMHQSHYLKNRPPNINNNHTGINLNQIQQQHTKLQPPPITSRQQPQPNNLNSQNQNQSHLKQIIPQQSHHPPQPSTSQQASHQQHLHLPQNNSNIINYNHKSNNLNKIVNQQNHKYNPVTNNNAAICQTKINQSKHCPQVVPNSNAIHQSQQKQQQSIVQQSQQSTSQIQVIQVQKTIQIPSTSHNQITVQQSSNIQSVIKSTMSQQHSNASVNVNQNKIVTSVTIHNTKTATSILNSQQQSSTSKILANTATADDSQLSIPDKDVNTLNTTVSELSNNVQKSTSVSKELSDQLSSKSNKNQAAITTSNVEITHNDISNESSNSEVIITDDAQSTAISTENISSGKEKTPMCLVNELARYNQIQHQYRLIGEQGPAHSKRFTVILKLGEEEYTAEGLSIKKAQHSAAAEAITKTKYEHPPPKKSRHKNGTNRFGMGNITPTVELNALAMKLGERVVYIFDSTTATPATPGNGNGILQHPNIQSAQVITGYQSNLSINPNQQIPQHAPQPPPVGGTTPLTNGPQPPPPQPPLPHLPNFYCENNYQYGQFNSRHNLVNIYLNGNGMRFPNLGRRQPPYNGSRGGFTKFRNRFMPPPPLNTFHPSFHRETCKITLLVGKQKFTGVGSTVQAAKHDAASRALEILKPIAESTEEKEDLDTTIGTGDSESDPKSPISMVYEIGLKRNLLVSFEVKSEIGPPHLKNFITVCKVGDFTTEGEGNGKKISKKRAAKKMLEELKKLPPLTPEKPSAVSYQNNKIVAKGNRGQKRLNGHGQQQQQQQQPTTNQSVTVKKRTKNVKDKSVISVPNVSECSEELNPISRLIQIQQALKEREPVYVVVEEKGAARRREFTIEATANGQSARGSGSNKKIAKRNAAKNLLIALGYEPDPSNKENIPSSINTDERSPKTISKVIEKEEAKQCSSGNKISNTKSQSGSSSRQIVPGLIQLPQKKTTEMKHKRKSESDDYEESDQSDSSRNDNSTNKAKTESSLTKEEQKEPEKKSTEYGVRPKDQLLYLAQLLGFEANFTDYPKGNHGEYLTIVALFTDPPQLCHGAGENTDASQDNAALAALQMLSKLGLDNVKPKKIQQSNNSSHNSSSEISDDNKKSKTTTNDTKK